MALGRRFLKTEHAGAKNGGGAWDKRADAKRKAKRLRRIQSRKLARSEASKC